jgi:hypothetical protein
MKIQSHEVPQTRAGKSIAIRMSVEQIDALLREAHSRRTSLSQLCRLVLQDWLTGATWDGITKPPTKTRPNQSS